MSKARRGRDNGATGRGNERGNERGNGLGARRDRHRRPQAPKRADPRFSSRAGRMADDSFTCGHCRRFVGSLPSGGRHRNHCPYCLYSRHVDAATTGDRASGCGGLMAPIGAFQRPNGEHVVVHRCLGCGFERFNRIAADDDFDLVLSLPVLPPRRPHPLPPFPAKPGGTEAPTAPSSSASGEAREVPPAHGGRDPTL